MFSGKLIRVTFIDMKIMCVLNTCATNNQKITSIDIFSLQYYDVRKKCEGSLCYDFSNMEKFLGQKSVKEALGVGDIDFVSCSPTVYQAMLMDWMRNLEVGIPALLEDGIKLLVYAGEYDLICNWLGK
jgi:serine carboxypeptidase-like clade 4